MIRPDDDSVDLDEAAASYAEQDGGSPATRHAAREHLVLLGLPLASRLARRYRERGESLEDLEQVARLGLVKAVRGYDPARGSFTAYTVITIMGEIRKHFRDRTWGVHVPRRLQDLVVQMRHADADLTSELSRSPNAAELADRLHTSPGELEQAHRSAAGYRPASLNAPASTEGAAELGDLIGGPDPDLRAVDDRLTVTALLGRLPERERRILILRFYGNLTQADIAERIGVSQMHVSRLLSRTLTWLRHAMLSDAPPQWADVDGGRLDSHRLRLVTTVAASTATVTVSGEVDRDNAEQLRAALRAPLTRQPGLAAVRVNLGGVPFIDAAGAAALLDGHRAARHAGAAFHLDAVHAHVARTLAAAGLR